MRDARIELMRRFVVEMFNRHDLAACRALMADDYALRVGEATFTGRDATYVPAVQKQLAQFPGLGMTVHAVVTDGAQVALVFTEHGASYGADGGARLAAWSGVALYRSDGERLTSCAAEEDYWARRRQLATGGCDPVGAPAIAPWDTAPGTPDPSAEAIVRAWLPRIGRADEDDGVRRDDEALTLAAPLGFDAHETRVHELFSAGDQVAFHVAQTGRYRGGLDVPSVAKPVVMTSAGVVRVVNGRVGGGWVVRDRSGLRRAVAQK